MIQDMPRMNLNLALKMKETRLKRLPEVLFHLGYNLEKVKSERHGAYSRTNIWEWREGLIQRTTRRKKDHRISFNWVMLTWPHTWQNRQICTSKRVNFTVYTMVLFQVCQMSQKTRDPGSSQDKWTNRTTFTQGCAMKTTEGDVVGRQGVTGLPERLRAELTDGKKVVDRRCRHD